MNWIKTSERLPSKDQWVVAVDMRNINDEDDYHLRICQYRDVCLYEGERELRFVYSDHCCYMYLDPTHWAPISEITLPTEFLSKEEVKAMIHKCWSQSLKDTEEEITHILLKDK